MEPSPSEDRPAVRRALILGGAALVSLAALVIALLLGAWAFEYRRLSLHEGRLKNLVDKQPTVSVASEGLTNEGWTTLAAEVEDPTLARLFGADPPPRVAEVRAKRARWPTARVFGNGDLVYVLFFGPDGKAADFSLVKR
jgi:hypothetical protein